MRNDVQLPSIKVKKKGTKDNRVPTMGEEQVVQFENVVKVNQEKQSDHPHIKGTVPVDKCITPFTFP